MASKLFGVGLFVAALVGLSGCAGGASDEPIGAEEGVGAGLKGTWVGKVQDTDAFVALIADGEQIVGYISDDGGMAEWFQGPASGPEMVLTNENGAELRASFLRGVKGSVMLSDGDEYEYTAEETDDTVLFRADGSTDDVRAIVGWIRIGDETRGSVIIEDSTISLQAAPPLPELVEDSVTAPGEAPTLAEDSELALKSIQPQQVIQPPNIGVEIQLPDGIVQITIDAPNPMTPDTLVAPPANTTKFVWAAMGDSYASGEGNPEHGINNPNNPDSFTGLSWGHDRSIWIPPSDITTLTSTEITNMYKADLITCHRSDEAGAPKANRRLKTLYPGVTFVFGSAACSGAKIEHLFGPDKKTGNLYTGPGTLANSQFGFQKISQPPQIDRVKTLFKDKNGPLDALYMQIGGNDLGFADLVVDCAVDEILFPTIITPEVVIPAVLAPPCIPRVCSPAVCIPAACVLGFCTPRICAPPVCVGGCIDGLPPPGTVITPEIVVTPEIIIKNGCLEKWTKTTFNNALANVDTRWTELKTKIVTALGNAAPRGAKTLPVFISPLPNPLAFDGGTSPCQGTDYDEHGDVTIFDSTPFTQFDNFLSANVYPHEADFLFEIPQKYNARLRSVASRNNEPKWTVLRSAFGDDDSAHPGGGLCTDNPRANLNSDGMETQGHDFKKINIGAADTPQIEVPGELYPLSNGMIHPNDDGYEAYADVILEAMRPSVIDPKVKNGLKKPTGVRIAKAALHGNITLRWNDVSTSENAYEIEVLPVRVEDRAKLLKPAGATSLPNGNGAYRVRVTGVNRQEFVNVPKPGAGMFKYRVRACNTGILGDANAQCKEFSDFVTGANFAPSIPTGLTFTSNGRRQKLSWAPQQEAIEYVVRKTDAMGVRTETRTNATSLQISGSVLEVAACNRLGCSLYAELE